MNDVRSIIADVYQDKRWLRWSLWEMYGVPPTDGDQTNLERQLYIIVADRVLATMRLAAVRPHAGTQYRLASAIIHEIAGAQTRCCPRCAGTGKNKRKRSRRNRCEPCRGTGMIRPTLTSRAEACQCNLAAFKDYLHGPYLTVLAWLQREYTATSRLKSLPAPAIAA